MEKEKKKGSTAQIVRGLAEPVAAELGLRIWDVVFLKEGADWFLRIYIDSDCGVSIDDCVDMSRALDPLLDENDLISQEYTLEVSSPGIDRKLTKLQHFQQFIGYPVCVRLIRPLEDRRRELSGILLQADADGSFVIQIDDETTVRFEKKECAGVTLDSSAMSEIMDNPLNELPDDE